MKKVDKEYTTIRVRSDIAIKLKELQKVLRLGSIGDVVAVLLGDVKL
jgi:hypothetical protein